MFREMKIGTEVQRQDEDPFWVHVTVLFDISKAPPSFKTFDDNKSLSDRNELISLKYTQ